MSETANLVNMVTERYGYHAGLLKARAELRGARIELGEPTLKSKRQKLSRDTANLYKRAGGMSAGKLKETIGAMKTLDEEIIAIKKDIANLTERERTKVQRFTEMVDSYDEQVVEELRTLELYKETFDLPEEEAMAVVVAEPVTA